MPQQAASITAAASYQSTAGRSFRIFCLIFLLPRGIWRQSRLSKEPVGCIHWVPVFSHVIHNGTTPRSLTTRNNTVNLTAANSHSGGTTLASGGINFVSGALGTGPLTLAGTLTWAAGNSQDITANRHVHRAGAERLHPQRGSHGECSNRRRWLKFCADRRHREHHDQPAQ